MVYPTKHVEPVRGLTVAQLVLGVVITLFHVITTAIDDHFHESIETLRRVTNDQGFLAGEPLLDIGGTGIWVGAMIIIAASIGIFGYRKQNRCLIIFHLILNALILLSTFSAMFVISVTIATLNNCENHGLRYYRYEWSDGSTPAPITFYGEVISGTSGSFRCGNVMFSIWKALDGVIIASYVVEFIITIILTVYNSLAMCLCCRRCCVCYRLKSQDEPQMTYSNLNEDAVQVQRRPPAQMVTPVQNGMRVQTRTPQPQTVQHLQPVQQTVAVQQTRPTGQIVYQVPVVNQPQRFQQVQTAASLPVVSQFQPIQQAPVGYHVQQVSRGATPQPVFTSMPSNVLMSPQGGVVQQVAYAPRQKLQPQIVSSSGQPLSEEDLRAAAIAASKTEVGNSGDKWDELAPDATCTEGGGPNPATEN